MNPRRSGSDSLRIEVGRRIPIPCRNCGGELISFIVTIGASRLWCGACKRVTHIAVVVHPSGLRITTRGES